MEMSKLEKTIKGFTICSEHGLLNGEDCHGHYEYTDNLADIIKANDYSKQCPYNGCKTGCVKTLAKDTLALLKEKKGLMLALEQSNAVNGYLNAEVERLNGLLKEQETGHWILLENCSNFGVYCSECHTKVFDNYPFKKKFSYFCPHCGTRMEGEIERR